MGFLVWTPRELNQVTSTGFLVFVLTLCLFCEKLWITTQTASGTFWNLHNQHGPLRRVEKAKISKYLKKKEKKEKKTPPSLAAHTKAGFPLLLLPTQTCFTLTHEARSFMTYTLL